MPGLRVLLIAVLCVAVLGLAGSHAVLAKKPPKPPPPPPDPEPDPDPVVAYKTSDRDGPRLWVMNADGSNQTLVFYANGKAISRPDWSPDGTRLAFGSSVNDNMGLYVINLDGTGLTKIASTVILPIPAWSPKAVPGAGGSKHRIAFTDRGTEGSYGVWNDVYIVDVDGSNRRPVLDTPDEMEGKSAWSPDGTKLVYSISDNTGDRFGIYDFTADQNTVYRHGGAMQGYHCFWPAWARTQSDKIAWHVMIGHDRDIFISDLDDLDHPVRLTSGGTIERFPGFSPDDTKIVFEDQHKKNGKKSIAVMNASDGSGRTVIHETGTDPMWKR